MFSRLAQASARQREIAEVVLRNGWGYMRRLLTGTKAEEPQLPPPAVLRNILVELGPVYVKLGQLLSTRPDLLPPEYITELTALQAEVPAVAWQEVEVVIRQQLRRPLEEAFTTINHQPVAAGSIAQTHRATLFDGREVALKIQRPGIEAIVDQDIALIRSLADLVSRTNFGKYYDLKALAEEFATALLGELDFMQEATHTDQLRSNLSSSRWFDPKQLVVPEIYWELTTEKLLVMEWLDGVPLLQGTLLWCRSRWRCHTAERKRDRRLASAGILSANLYRWLFPCRSASRQSVLLKGWSSCAAGLRHGRTARSAYTTGFN